MRRAAWEYPLVRLVREARRRSRQYNVACSVPTATLTGQNRCMAWFAHLPCKASYLTEELQQHACSAKSATSAVGQSQKRAKAKAFFVRSESPRLLQLRQAQSCASFQPFSTHDVRASNNKDSGATLEPAREQSSIEEEQERLELYSFIVRHVIRCRRPLCLLQGLLLMQRRRPSPRFCCCSNVTL